MGQASIDTTTGYVLINPFDAVTPIEVISRLGIAH